MATKEDIAQARDLFAHLGLAKGDQVFTILRHLSKSGMSRDIDVVVIRDNEPYTVSWAASKLVGRRQSPNGGVRCVGAGMDMGFDLVYSLSTVLFGDGYALKQRWL